MAQIGVIVPVYKVEKYIKRCVDSILAQTFTDFEVILVDDGSPDNCGAICDEYAKKDSRVAVIHQENGGLSAARNAGVDWVFANSNSQWLTFIDSDDWVHPKYLEVMFNAVQKTGTSFSICKFERTDGENPLVDEKDLNVKVWDTESFYCEDNVTATVAWGKLYRKECFQKIRYPVGKIHEDEFTTYKIFFENKSVAVIDQPMYAYFSNSEGIMGQRWSEKKLHLLEALDERIKWFQNRKITGKVLRKTLEMRFCYTREFIDIIEKDYPEYQGKVLKKIKRNLALFLFKHPEEFPFDKYKWYYELAYPFEMQIYWMTKAQLDKIKRLLKI